MAPPPVQTPHQSPHQSPTVPRHWRRRQGPNRPTPPCAPNGKKSLSSPRRARSAVTASTLTRGHKSLCPYFTRVSSSETNRRGTNTSYLHTRKRGNYGRIQRITCPLPPKPSGQRATSLDRSPPPPSPPPILPLPLPAPTTEIPSARIRTTMRNSAPKSTYPILKAPPPNRMT